MKRGFVFFSLFIVVPLFLLEVGVRIWGYSFRCLYDPIYMPYEKSADIPYVHKPNLKHVRARGNAVINTDSLGLRSSTVGAVYGPKTEDRFRVAVIGDSVTFGEGVPSTDETYPAVLQQLLNRGQEKKQARVFNFGVSAYSVKQMVATLRLRAGLVEPDFVVMAIVPEDFFLSRVGTVDKWGYTVHAETTGLVDENSQLKRILRKVHLTYLIRDLMYRYCGSGENSLYSAVPSGTPVHIEEDVYRYVPEFREIAERMRLPYLIVLLPPISHTFDSVFLDQLRRDRIDFLDLEKIRQEFSLEEYRAGRFDGHPGPMVHRRIAEELASSLLHRLQ